MSILDKVISKNLLWNIKTQSLPHNIREYKCDFVLEECQFKKEIIEKIYLRFVHPENSSTFQISINELNRPTSCIYEAEIDTAEENPNTTIKQQYDSICFTSVHNYERPQVVYTEIQAKEGYPDSEDEVIPCFQDYFGIDSEEDQYNDSKSEQSLVDFAPENEKFVQHEVLMYLKKQANRFKKMRDIKSHLQTLKYNVPDNHLKKIVSGYCGSHLFDKKNGYLVREEYLSPEERNNRRLQRQDVQKKEKAKEMKKGERKKVTKKESTNGKKKITITNEQLITYARGQNNHEFQKILKKDIKKK